MSDTPVTNLNTWTTICGNLKGAQSENEDELYVPVSVSQKLERELNAANIKIEGLRSVVARFEEVPENIEKADLVQNCKNLTAQLNAANERIKRLEQAGDACASEPCGCVCDGPCSHAPLYDKWIEAK